MEKETQKNLERFTQEIAELQRKEEARELETAHFLKTGFNPEELSEEDLLIWEKVKDGSVTREDWEGYRVNLIDPETRSARPGIPRSRYTFMAFIGNKAGAIMGMRELEKIRAEKE